MWSFRPLRIGTRYLSLILLAALHGCTVEPLNAAKPDNVLASDSASATVSIILAAIEVAAVNERVAQQVRNELVFGLNGGQVRSGGRYKVNLTVTHSTSRLSVESSAATATSAQVRITARYLLTDKTSGKVVANDKRLALASYDRTPQSFANQRAERDAQNRAAKDVARQIRLALGQTIAGL